VNLAPPPRQSDAEMAAEFAATALRDGRYALGKALASIAQQAAAADHQRRTVNVPWAGMTHRHEVPVRDFYEPRTGPRVVHPVANGTGPTGDGDADLEAAAIGAQLERTAVMPAPDLSRAPIVPDSARCVARVTREGVVDECHGVAYWAPGQVGDSSTPATVAGWRHVDPAMDQHHTPEINL
jgi:hypothetical protein